MSTDRWRLVGRNEQLSELSDLLDRAVSEGRGSVVLVSGEPGIGKTRLLEAAADQARDKNVTSAWGRAWELGNAPPYWPWIEILRTLANAPKGRAGRYEDLCNMLPELEAGVGAATAKTGEPVDAFAVSDAIVAHLRSVSAENPLLLLLDDLHAADHATLAVAEFVARQLAFMPVVLFGSHREAEARLDASLSQLLGRIGRSGEPMALSRLGEVDVRSLVRARLGRDDAEVSRLIYRATEGNPLFVEELLRLVAARGSAVSGGVPAGIRAVIRDRLALLSPATVALLQAAAIVGRDFAVQIVAEMAGVTAAALEEATDEAVATDLLEQSEPGRLRFSHALVAETLATDLPTAVGSRLHRRCAEILEREHTGDPGAPLEEIARHWLAAGTEQVAHALPVLERAARRASERLAFDDAAALWERALSLLQATLPGDTERRAELLITAGEAHARAGNRSRAAEACAEAASIAKARDDGELFARAALALGAEGAFGGRDETLVELLGSALVLMPETDSPTRALLLARFAAARQPENDPEAPIELAKQAIDMARRLGDGRLLLSVLHFAMGAMTDYARAEVRRPLNHEAMELAQRFGDRARGLRARLRLCFDCAELCDPTGFDSAVRDYEVLANQVGQARYSWIVPMLRSMRAAWQGNFSLADELELEALGLRQQAGDNKELRPPGRRMSQGMLRADPELITLGFDDYERSLGRSALSDQVLPFFRAMYRGESAADAASPLSVFGPLLDGFLRSIHFLELLEQAAWLRRDAELAKLVYPRYKQHAGRPQIITGVGYSLHSLVDQGLTRLCLILGNIDAAERHAKDALALAEKLGARPIALRVYVDLAQGLLDQKGPAAAARARELLESARVLLVEMQSASLAELVGSLERRLEGLSESQVPAAEQLRIEREGDTWSIGGFGEACRLRDGRGIQMLAQLLEQPGREFHVLDLSGTGQAVDGGDSGEVLDARARAEYAARLRDLEAELQEATEWNDAGRSERLRVEADALRTELASATGLGGRERRVGSAAERARVNVQRRIALALKKITESAPLLGRHLQQSIRTGTYCAYVAEPTRKTVAKQDRS